MVDVMAIAARVLRNCLPCTFQTFRLEALDIDLDEVGTPTDLAKSSIVVIATVSLPLPTREAGPCSLDWINALLSPNASLCPNSLPLTSALDAMYCSN